jgi:hypothetical protein
MANKKHQYQSDTISLPPMKMILGEVPEPDPNEKRRPVHSFSENQSEVEAKNLVTKLIGYLKKNEK